MPQFNSTKSVTQNVAYYTPFIRPRLKSTLSASPLRVNDAFLTWRSVLDMEKVTWHGEAYLKQRNILDAEKRTWHGEAYLTQRSVLDAEKRYWRGAAYFVPTAQHCWYHTYRIKQTYTECTLYNTDYCKRTHRKGIFGCSYSKANDGKMQLQCIF